MIFLKHRKECIFPTRKMFIAMIYLDNAATTKPSEAACKAVCACMTESFGNPSSLHTLGIEAQNVLDCSRSIIAKALSCEPDCIFFTSGATESSNLAVFGAVGAYGKRKRRIITSSVEHSSIKETMLSLENQGFEIVRVSPQTPPEEICALADENTCLISMMCVNNETGHILPIKTLFNSIKRRFPHIITHCDTVQGFMKLPIKADDIKADLISLSAHKIYGPKGTGALYIRKGVRVLPLILGGKQEKGIRSGTEAVPLIAGFGATVRELIPTIKERFNYVVALKAHLLDELSSLDGVTVNSPDDASPYIVNISVEGYRSEIMLHFLEERKIYVSSGSACSKGAKSGVLSEFGMNDRLADSALRISFSPENTTEDIDALVSAIAEGQAKIRKK